MPDTLPLSEKNLNDKKLEQELNEDTQSPEYFDAHAKEVRKQNEEFEKRQNDENKISPEDYDFLTDLGFNLGKRGDIETDAGTMIEIPRNEGQSAFVKPENFQKWINNLKDEQGLADARKELEGAFGENGKEKQSEDLEAEDKEELESLKTSLYDLAESVKKLYSGFSERDNDNFNPLIYPEDIGKLLSSAQGLENIIDNIKADESYLSGAISKIAQVVEEIGNVSQRGGVNEDEDSLTRITYLLNDVENQCDNILTTTGRLEKYDATSLRASVHKLFDTTQDRRFYVGRKLEAFRDYN